MTYAFVEDIPASWEEYELVDAVIADPFPEGLILHVAGPTDDGVQDDRGLGEQGGMAALPRRRGPARPTSRRRRCASSMRCT